MLLSKKPLILALVVFGVICTSAQQYGGYENYRDGYHNSNNGLYSRQQRPQRRQNGLDTFIRTIFGSRFQDRQALAGAAGITAALTQAFVAAPLTTAVAGAASLAAVGAGAAAISENAAKTTAQRERDTARTEGVAKDSQISTLTSEKSGLTNKASKCGPDVAAVPACPLGFIAECLSSLPNTADRRTCTTAADTIKCANPNKASGVAAGVAGTSKCSGTELIPLCKDGALPIYTNSGNSGACATTGETIVSGKVEACIAEDASSSIMACPSGNIAAACVHGGDPAASSNTCGGSSIAKCTTSGSSVDATNGACSGTTPIATACTVAGKYPNAQGKCV